jgi:hypothetical protein
MRARTVWQFEKKWDRIRILDSLFESLLFTGRILRLSFRSCSGPASRFTPGKIKASESDAPLLLAMKAQLKAFPRLILF